MLFLLWCLPGLSGTVFAAALVRHNFVGQASGVVRAVGEKHEIADILPVFGLSLAERLPIGANQYPDDHGQLVWPVYDVAQLMLGQYTVNLLHALTGDASVLWLTRRGKLVQWFLFESEIPANGLTLVGKGRAELALVELSSSSTQHSRLLIINRRGKVVENLATQSKLDEIRFFKGNGTCLLQVQSSGIAPPHRLALPALAELGPRWFCLHRNGQLGATTRQK
jgi:hypothetical protein